MKLIFTKGSGKYDRLDVLRENAEPERVECPKQGIIPHDMVHYAVEKTLQTRGFFGRVKDAGGRGAGGLLRQQGMCGEIMAPAPGCF